MRIFRNLRYIVGDWIYAVYITLLPSKIKDDNGEKDAEK